MRYKIALLFILFFFFSCSSIDNAQIVKDNTLDAPTTNEILKDFEIEDKKFDKFKSLENTTQPSNKKIIKSKRNSKKKKIANIVKYPEDYPELFKEYDEKYAPLWKKYKKFYPEGEKLTLEFTYLGITAGHAFIEVKHPKEYEGREAAHYYARLKSNPAFKFIYELDDYLESFVDLESILPLKYFLVQRESRQDVDDLQLFDSEQRKSFYFYKRIKKSDNNKLKEEKDDVYIPTYFQDSFSAVHFIRGLPFEVGNKYEFPIVTRAKTWIIKGEIVALEKISTPVGDFNAYKFKVETHYPGVLKARDHANFWFSADENKIPLKFTAKVKIGSIKAQLIELELGKQI